MSRNNEGKRLLNSNSQSAQTNTNANAGASGWNFSGAIATLWNTVIRSGRESIPDRKDEQQGHGTQSETTPRSGNSGGYGTMG